MADDPSPQLVSALLIITTIFHVLAIIVTSFRLWFRYHIRKLWWDDFWAALALLCDAVCMVTAWIVTAPLDNPYTTVEALSTPALPRQVHLISYWLSVLFYTCAIWFSRISIVFSVVRIVPPAQSVNMIVLGSGGAFVGMWLYVLIAKSVVCSVNKAWYHSFFILCPMPCWVAISEVCTDVLSDVILVAIPVYLLWRVRLPSSERIMVLSVFSTSILVSVVSVVHTSYLIPRATFIGGITAEFEGAVSLIVCNLLVVVSFFYRVTKNNRGLTPRVANKYTRSSNHLTTVDLNFTGGSRFTTNMGTATELSRVAFTGTDVTGTQVSSVVFATMSDKDTTFNSIAEPVTSVLPASALGADMPRMTTSKR